MNQRELYLTHSPPQSRAGLVRTTLRELAPQDWIVFVYLSLLVLIAWSCDASPGRDGALRNMGALLVFLVATLSVVRSGVLTHKFWAPLLYRLAIYGGVQLSYFFLSGVLPLVNTTTLDHELYELDMALFGFEPAMMMDSIVTPVTTEWFAFFYFSYFFLLALHVIPILMGSRSRRFLSEFALGLILVFCVGHLVYMLVPGFGPYKAMADSFSNPLPSGMWLDLVMATVASGGAQMDIFPSLHTAAPTFIALFSYRYRDRMPFRYSWVVVALFAVNIIIATMFLRWHYLIDVIAGLLLASLAFLSGVVFTSSESSRRAQLRTDSWPMFGHTGRVAD
ncbi:MAG: phosphatase PAP2 family protein [Polyangiaceae bacterium]|nr:phosphatase PAP2 family protein [Polyangiaceae bacterium]